MGRLRNKMKKPTRLTIIYNGKRIFEKYDVKIEEVKQDDNQTLKLIVEDKKK